MSIFEQNIMRRAKEWESMAKKRQATETAVKLSRHWFNKDFRVSHYKYVGELILRIYFE